MQPGKQKSEKENVLLKKKKYSEEQIRDILTTAYPGKTEEEIEAMVQETMAQYLAEAEELSKRKK
jgi:lauroyl/myristoyl acyltransferase